jgi:hypothetical protein
MVFPAADSLTKLTSSNSLKSDLHRSVISDLRDPCAKIIDNSFPRSTPEGLSRRIMFCTTMGGEEAVVYTVAIRWKVTRELTAAVNLRLGSGAVGHEVSDTRGKRCRVVITTFLDRMGSTAVTGSNRPTVGSCILSLGY